MFGSDLFLSHNIDTDTGSWDTNHGKKNFPITGPMLGGGQRRIIVKKADNTKL